MRIEAACTGAALIWASMGHRMVLSRQALASEGALGSKGLGQLAEMGGKDMSCQGFANPGSLYWVVV